MPGFEYHGIPVVQGPAKVEKVHPTHHPTRVFQLWKNMCCRPWGRNNIRFIPFYFTGFSHHVGVPLGPHKPTQKRWTWAGKTNPILFRIFWGLLEETPVVMIDTLHLFPESYEHVLNVTKRYPKMKLWPISRPQRGSLVPRKMSSNWVGLILIPLLPCLLTPSKSACSFDFICTMG